MIRMLSMKLIAKDLGFWPAANTNGIPAIHAVRYFSTQVRSTRRPRGEKMVSGVGKRTGLCR